MTSQKLSTLQSQGGISFSTVGTRATLCQSLVLQVEELICNSQLNIASEEKVFTAVMSWTKHDLAGREQYVAQVLALYSAQSQPTARIRP